MNRFVRLLAGTALCTSLGGASIASADDTEIFFARAVALNPGAANVLFMFDTSGSMDEFDGTPLTRINRLKQATLRMLEQTSGVNVGIGAFNGQVQGGAILQPVVDPDADVCPGGACDAVTVRATLLSPDDDAQQRRDGSVELDETVLDFANDLAGETAVLRTYKVGNGADDAMQIGDAVVVDESVMYLFDTLPASGAVTRLGLRFEGIRPEPDARLIKAHVVFASGGRSTSRQQDAVIRIGDTAAPASFSDTPGERLHDRTTLPDHVTWNEIPWTGSENRAVVTENIARLLKARMSASNWTDGDAVEVFFDHGPSGRIDAARTFKGWESAPGVAAELRLIWAPADTRTETVGLRFANLNVPRGATITHASLELASKTTSGQYATELRIRAENSGDAAAFKAMTTNLTARTITTEQVDWEAPVWEEDEGIQVSPDVGSLVQKIVTRDDWCAGNALALILDGTGHRQAYSRDRDEWIAPVLRIRYDPSSVDYTDTCIKNTVRSRPADSADDATQAKAAGSTPVTDGQTLASGSRTEAGLIGLRFTGIDVPRGATVSRATLSLTSAKAGIGGRDLSMTLHAEATDHAAPFSAVDDIASRTRGGASVVWNDVPDLGADDRSTGPDVSAIVQQVIERADWASGNAMALILEHQGGSDQPAYVSHDADPGNAASLVIEYQLKGSATGGVAPVLQTQRERLIDEVLDLPYIGGTPLVDAYLEAASYMTGADVLWGKTRGSGDEFKGEQIFSVSAPASWTGGTLWTPPNCSEVDPHSVACVGERIDGDPVYTAPVAGSCQANQIVLLSDGDPTSNSSSSLIRSMTGDASCAARDDRHEACGLELAEWLTLQDGDGTAGNPQRVITHTVGFNISTTFLSQIASAGAGSYRTADSASQLASVFNTIIQEAADVTTTFVAPVASANRFNRLTNGEDVYFAMFKPDLTDRWNGNLKRYRLGPATEGGETTIVDSKNKPLFNVTGIDKNAESFWPDALPGPDGNIVGAGGAANQMPTTRTVKTFVYSREGVPQELIDLHEDTQRLNNEVLKLEDESAEYRTTVLKWARGVDVRDVDNDGDITEVRQQMGDPLHSTPAVLNYLVDEQEISRVFVGTNEGYLHAIDTANGSETWSIVPVDLLPNLAPMLENETIDGQRPYGLDGGIATWTTDANGNGAIDGDEKAYVIVGMRRGGRNYYAFDVSDPEAPKMAWVIRGGTRDFEELGQSWSAPAKARIRVGEEEKDVLVFGGGYDTAHDTAETRKASNDAGRAIIIVDASDGTHIETLKSADFTKMKYSIPAQPNVIDINLDGLADLMFVGDMGGQVWRFDIDNVKDRNAGVVITGDVIADLHGRGNVIDVVGFGGRAGNRRFYDSPDVSLLQDEQGNVALNIAIGSGWRAHPLDEVVQDRFYSLRQGDVFGPPLNDEGDIDYTTLTESDLFDATSASGSSDTSGKIAKGWLIALGRDGDTGEKVLSPSLTVNGTVLFTTYLPNSSSVGACGIAVGSGRLYKVDARTADPVEDLATSTDDDGVLTLGDRWRNLNIPGIPVGPQIFVGANDPDTPIIATGDGTENSGLGAARERTFWVEN